MALGFRGVHVLVRRHARHGGSVEIFGPVRFFSGELWPA
jgi:hypothetical protein